MSIIEDRDYLKQELADKFYPFTTDPDSRKKALWREINGCPELVAALEKLHWNRKAHSYTRLQVRMIKELLCRD